MLEVDDTEQKVGVGIGHRRTPVAPNGAFGDNSPRSRGSRPRLQPVAPHGAGSVQACTGLSRPLRCTAHAVTARAARTSPSSRERTNILLDTGRKNQPETEAVVAKARLPVDGGTHSGKRGHRQPSCRRGRHGTRLHQPRRCHRSGHPRSCRARHPRHHSQTLPSMSYKPQAFGRFWPTGCVVFPEFSWYHASSSRLGHAPDSLVSSLRLYSAAIVPAGQAYSHSASDGSRECRSPSSDEADSTSHRRRPNGPS